MISIQDQGCTCAQWKTYYGENKIKNKLIEKGYQLDSIAINEFNTSGLLVDSLNLYFPYDGFQINFEIDTVVLNINGTKKYCPLLKVNSWSHENKYLELVNYFSFIICLLILVGIGIKNIVFNLVKK